MKHYITLLKREPILRKLSLIQLIAYFGAWFSNVAIYTLLIEMEVSPSVIAMSAALHFMAGILQAPFSGSIIDAIKPKKLMLGLLLVEILATLSLLFVNSVQDLWLLFLLIFVRMAAASFYFTTEMSLLPKILDGDDLQKGNEIHSIIWSFSYTLGMAISGFIVYMFGVKIAFLLDALMFMIALYILYTLKIEIVIAQMQESFFKMMRGSFTYLKKTPQALHLMVIHAFVGLTAFDALVALMVENYYSSIIATSLALGLMHASRAVGLVVGPIILGKWINNTNLVKLFIFQALSIWLWAFVMEDFYLSLVASVCVGFFTTTLWSYTYTLLQKNVDKAYYGRVVAYNDMLFLSSATFTSIMIGFLASNSYSLEMISVFIGGAFLLGALYTYWVLKTQTIKDIG